MLCEQSPVPETVSIAIDNLPLGLIISEDGQTLLVADHENEGMEWISAPVTFIQPNNSVISSPIKVTNSNTTLNSSIYQLNFEPIIQSINAQQSLSNLHTQDDSTTLGVIDPNEIVQKQIVNENNDYQNLSSNTVDNIGLINNANVQLTICNKPLVRTLNTIIKRPRGRPKKDSANIIEPIENVCDICGEKFKKQILFRKHMDDHAKEKPHRCPKCPASFNIPTNFTLHMATHNTGELKCPECDRKFARMASLKSHILFHQKEEHLFCTECEDAFPTKAQLDTHLRLHNEKWTTDDVKKCKLCHKQFTQPALYRVHIRDHYKLQTKIMKQTKRGPTHKTLHKCRICLKIFQKPSQLMRHIRVHTGERPFVCNSCGRAFTQKSSLQIHKWRHVGARPFSCDQCNAKFSQKGNLNAHVARVHNPPEGGGPGYSCMMCSCVFRRIASLSVHMKKMHRHPVEKSKCDSSTEMNKDKNKYESTMINLSVKNNADSTDSELNNQQRSDILQEALKNSGLSSKEKNTNIETKVESRDNYDTSYVTLLDKTPDGALRRYITIKQRNIDNIKWYACNYCHKEFKKPSDLIRHLRVHTQEKPYKCPHCYRSFALKSTMLAHERTHTGIKKYACGVCGKKFACHSSLNAHTRSAHVKPNKCEKCGKTFNSNSLLKSHAKTHMKTKTKISPDAEALIPQIILEEPLMISDVGNQISVAHIQSKQKQINGENDDDDGRPHKCWVCPAAFRKISHLKQHYRRHTGERPFKCTKCDRRFTSNSVLKAHLQTHEKSRPYNCNVCNAKFSTQSSMKRHLVTHSNKRPFMCPYCHKTFKTTVNCRKHMKIHRTELAQQQLEKTKIQISTTVEENSSIPADISETLNLHDDVSNTFPQNITTDFTQAFNDQLKSIVTVDKNNLPNINVINVNTPNNSIAENLSAANADNLETTQTLHADETGTITLPNYSGDGPLTQDNIRELEETLNQELFNLDVNLGLGNNLSRQINGDCITEERDRPVINIIYDNPKELNHNHQQTANTNIFTPSFDTFDISQITLQADTEMDIGINPANSTSMASILPRSAQEEQHLIIPTVTGNIIKNNNHIKDGVQQLVVVNNSSQIFQQQLSKIQSSYLKYPKIIAKADTTNNTDINLQQHQQQQQELHNEIIESNENLACQYCDKIFRKIHDLKVHVVLTHVTNNIKLINEDNDKGDNELLQCHMCYKKGFNALSLKEHLSTHRGAKEFQCTECHLKFCTNGGLSRHLKIHNVNKTIVDTRCTCAVCFDTFTSEIQLKLHEKTTHGNVDDDNNMTQQTVNWNVTKIEPDSSQQQTDINTELLTVNTVNTNEKMLLNAVINSNYFKSDIDNQLLIQKINKEYDNKCEYCPKTFRKPSDLIRHVRTHTGERPYRCEHCNKSFAVKCTLDCHMKVHTGNEKFCCHVCNRLFATKGSLKVHMRLHTGSKPFKCLMCDLKFRTSGHRKVHLLTHMRENKNNDGKIKRNKKIIESINPTTILSSGINEKFVKNLSNITGNNATSSEINATNLNHTADYQNLDTITIDTTGISDQLTFNPDGTILNNNSVLSVNESNQLVADLHFLIASGFVTIQTDETLLPQLNCPDTNINHDQTATATTTETETTHALVSSNNLEQTRNNLVIPTQIQNIQGSQQQQLNEVMALVEMSTVNSVNEIPSSNIETKAPVNKSNGKIQILKTQSKKECDICGKTFMKPCQVERHKRIHTGERPFKCELCAKSFAQKSTLQIHQKHHTGDRPHPCPHCNYSFTQKCNLQTHLKRVHQYETMEGKKLRRNQHIMSAKLYHDSNNINLNDNRMPNLDDLSFGELLK